MNEIIKELWSIQLVIGVIVGLCIEKIYHLYFHKIKISDTVLITEQLIDIFLKNGIQQVRDYIEIHITKFKKMKLWDGFSVLYPSYDVYGMLVIYTAHKCAKYEYSDKVKNIINQFALEYFGQESIGYQRYIEAENIINHSAKYYSDNGFPKESRQLSHHGKVSDYANNELYHLVYLIINSVYVDIFK